MKKLIYLYLALLIIACNSNDSNNNYNDGENNGDNNQSSCNGDNPISIGLVSIIDSRL
jgi:hypothetical protein